MDIYMLAKAFDLRFLKERLIGFGGQNRLALQQKQLLLKLDRADLQAIQKAAAAR